jgi:hypothetical protein
MVPAALDDRKARVRRLDHEVDPLLDRFGDVDHVHLRARDHQVARAQFRDLQDALNHRHGVGVEQVALVRVVQRFEEFFPVLRLAEDERGQAFEQALVLLRGSGAGRRGF